MVEEVFNQILEVIDQIKEDKAVPKNIVIKLNQIIEILNNEDGDMYIRIDKVLQELEEITSDSNLQPFIRTQLWNITSLLESI